MALEASEHDITQSLILMRPLEIISNLSCLNNLCLYAYLAARWRPKHIQLLDGAPSGLDT